MKYCVVFFSFFIPLISVTAQNSWQQKIDYDIRVSLDDVNNFLQGSEHITYRNNSPDTLYFLFFHAWPNAYSNKNTEFGKQLRDNGSVNFYFSKEEERGYIDSLNFLLDGNRISYAFQDRYGEIGKILLHDPLLPGETIKLETSFRVKIPGSFSRMGHEGQNYQLTQWYPKIAMYDKTGWHTMHYLHYGEYYNNFGSYRVSLSVPENYVVAATGVLQEETEHSWLKEKAAAFKNGTDTFTGTPPSSEKFKTITFAIDSVTDFAWFASKEYRVILDTVLLPNGKPVVTESFILRPGPANNCPRYIEDALVYYSEKVGNYPYPVMTVAEGALKAGDGMEYPTITVLSNPGNREVVFHETGHNWFQEVLATNERTNPWMDESINTFYEFRYSRKKTPDSAYYYSTGLFSKDLFLEYLDYHQQIIAKSQPVNMEADQFSFLNTGVMLYHRGPKLMDFLYHYLGEEKFDSAMKIYWERWKFDHPGPQDLQNIFMEVTGDSLNWFFEGLLSETINVDYAITGSIREDGKILQLKVKNKTGIPAPFLLAGFKKEEDGKKKPLENNVFVFWEEGFTGTKNIVLPDKDFDYVYINPHPVDIDVNFEDNIYYAGRLENIVKPLKVGFFPGLDNPKRNGIYFTPAPGFNANDGLMAGVIINNDLFPPQNLEYILMPQYGFKSKDLVGMGKVSLHRYSQNELEWNHLEIGVIGKSYHYDPLNLRYRKIEPFLKFTFQPIWKKQKAVSSVLVRSVLVHREEFSFPDDYSEKSYYINEFGYNYTNNRKVFPLDISVNLQQHSKFGKMFTEVKWGIPYPWKNQGATFRFFGGTFIYTQVNADKGEFIEREYQLRMANQLFFVEGQAGLPVNYQDYTYDQVLLDRSPEKGILSRQVYDNNGNFKINSSLGTTTKWLVSLGIMSSVPGRTPFRLFADIGTYAGIEGETQTMERPDGYKLLFDAGVALVIIKDIFEVYYPVVFSKPFENSLAFRGTKWHERIQFKLNLSALNPLKYRTNLEKLLNN